MFDFLKRFFNGSSVSHSVSGGHRTEGGRFFSGSTIVHNVTSETALQYSIINACVRQIANAIAELPLKMYRKGTEVDESPVKDAFNRRANGYLTGFELKELIGVNLALHGNFFAIIEKSGPNLAFYPIDPAKVEIHAEDLAKTGRVFYRVSFSDGQRDVEANQMLHIKGISRDGISGLDPVALLKTSIELGVSAEQYGKRYFDTDGSPVGVLSTEKSMRKEARDAMKKAWDESHGGSNKRAGIAVLDEGLKFEQVQLDNNNAQFLETRQYQAKQIALAFGVPYELLDPSGDVEAVRMTFLNTTVRALCSRIEAAINAQLAGPVDEFEFDLDSILRGDITKRFNSYAVAIQRFMTVNEIRELEGLAPVKDGDELLQPLNMVKLGYDAEQANAAAEQVKNGAAGNQNISFKGNQDNNKME